MADVKPLKLVDQGGGAGRLEEFGAGDRVPAENLPATEWTAETVAQAEAEAGTATTRRAWTAQRVRQAIVAWWNGSAARTQLDTATADIAGLASSKLDAGANAVSATKLATARTIGGVAFDGTANINLPGVNAAGNQSTSGNAATATKLATARTLGGVSFDGTANITLPGVNTEGSQNTTGNAATATKLATARSIALAGDVTGSANFDGTGNISITATVVDDSHNHTVANVAGLQTALDGKAANSHSHAVADVTGLQTALDGKEATIAAGTTAHYWRGDKTWRDLATDVRAAVLTGLSTATATVVGATDSVLVATGKLQAQVTGLSTSKLGTSANAVSATKWATGRTLTATGDATGATTAFDGTANASMALTLANTGVSAGSYGKVTVDAKGRVTAGAALAATDIPVLDATKVTTGVFAAARIPTLNQSTTGNSATATKLQTARSIALTGDVTGSATFDGSANVTITATVADDSIDFTIIYPNGGSAASPANVAANSRYILPNPFPGHHVLCQSEILYNNTWGDAGWYSASGAALYGAGVKATLLTGSGSESVIVQTGLNGVAQESYVSGSPIALLSGPLTTAPCRVKVWKVKGATA